MANELEQRARFETWLSTQPGATPIITVEQVGGAKEDTRYLSPSTSLTWNAWQAALQQAQQPGAQAVDQVEFIDVQNHNLRRGMQQLMAYLAPVLDEDQFAAAESIVLDAGVAPPPPLPEGVIEEDVEAALQQAQQPSDSATEKLAAMLQGLEFQPVAAAMPASVLGTACAAIAKQAKRAADSEAQQPGAQAVAWHTDDHLTDKSATTYDPTVADRWRAKGWPVTAHYTAPPPLPEGVSEVAALLLEWCAVKAWLAADDFDSPERGMRERLDQAAAQSERWLESYRARLAARGEKGVQS